MGSDEFCIEMAMAKMTLVKGVRSGEGISGAFRPIEEHGPLRAGMMRLMVLCAGKVRRGLGSCYNLCWAEGPAWV